MKWIYGKDVNFLFIFFYNQLIQRMFYITMVN